MKINQENQQLYEQAVRFTKKSSDGSVEITADELQQLKDLAQSDGKVTVSEKQFIKALDNKINVARIAAIGCEPLNKAEGRFELEISDGPEPDLSTAQLKEKYDCLNKNGYDITKIDKKIEKLIENSNINSVQFEKVIRLDINKQELFFKLSDPDFSNSAKVLDTFAYLDCQKINYKDITTLTENQLKKGFETPDILTAIQGYGIIHESLKFEPPVPEKDSLKKVAEAIKAGAFRMHEDAQENVTLEKELTEKGAKNLGDLNVGYYEPKNDLLLMGNMDIKNPERRALLLHELTHTAQDIKYAKAGKQNRANAETDGYLAQGLYLDKYDKPAKTAAELQKPVTFVETFTFGARRYARAYENLKDLEQSGASAPEIVKAKADLKEARKSMVDVMQQQHSPYGCCLEHRNVKNDGIKGFN